MKETYLITRDTKNKLRTVKITYDWDDEQHAYIINRYTGLYNGKIIEQPKISVTRGKANRTVSEQVELEYNSHIKKYKDKGYKELERDFDTYSEPQLNDIVGEIITNQSGIPKPMLAKQEADIKTRKIFDKEWIGSRKVDGVRCLMYWNGEEVKTASRGGNTYDPATSHIRNHPTFIAYFKEHPDAILDGELYKHGKSLQQISGAARQEKEGEKSNWLQYFIYDIVKIDIPFKDRLFDLKEVEETFNVSFNPNKEYKPGELQVQVLPQVKVKGWDNMMKLHNEYVAEGWEGLVIRDPEKPYKPNSRTNIMVKIKKYKDDCFKVVDIKKGLRGYQDMSFELITSEGKSFFATPIGSIEEKKEYWNNFEEKYKGHLGECKFFYYSDENIPLQPTFKAFRWDIE